jgi:DNA polymerase bacteriophage-type
MPCRLHLDFEVFSAIDLRDVGCYRYSADPSTDPLCCAFALDDGPTVIWHPGLDEIELMKLEVHFAALANPSVLLLAHNCMFEFSVLQFHSMKLWGIPAPDASRLRCTMSLARRASLPGKLEKLAEVLNLGNQKDARGKSLIRKFCVMQPPKKPTKAHPDGLPARRILPSDEPEAFKELLDYCVQDVKVEQEVFKKLSYFDDDLNNRNYTLDQRINARGVPVNLTALRHAQNLIDEETAIVSQKFRELTGFEVTQGAVFLQWLHGKGAHLDNLQAETIEMYLDNQEFAKKQGRNVALLENDKLHLIELSKDPEPIYALRLKQSIAYASIKKVKTMLECAGPHDNRIRGMLNHHGATTGRWTASLVQFQNMKRPTIKHSEDAYREICEGVSREMLEICYGPVLEVISSCIRHFVDPTENNL